MTRIKIPSITPDKTPKLAAIMAEVDPLIKANNLLDDEFSSVDDHIDDKSYMDAFQGRLGKFSSTLNSVTNLITAYILNPPNEYFISDQREHLNMVLVHIYNELQSIKYTITGNTKDVQYRYSMRDSNKKHWIALSIAITALVASLIIPWLTGGQEVIHHFYYGCCH